MGIPVVGPLLATGSVFFVNSVVGADGNTGTDSSKPYATIDKALSSCTDSKGDVIILMPGHTEGLTAATDVVVDKIGVSIIGVGIGANRPLFTFDGTAGSMEIDAANVRLENVVLQASVSAVVVGLNVDADGFEMHNVEFNFNATGDDFLTMVDIDAVDRHSITGCKFISESGAAGASEAIRLDDTHFVSIVGNHFTGQWSDSAIIGEGAAGTDLLIHDNVIYNADTASSTNGMNISVAFTGVISNNRVGTLYATNPDTAIDPGSCLCSENYISNAVDESGALVPVTVST
jgi:hypothetical protein